VLQADVEAFLCSLQTGFSDNTILAYQNDLNQFVKFIRSKLGDSSSLQWSQVNRDLLMNYIVNLKERHYSATTVARKIAAVRSFSPI